MENNDLTFKTPNGRFNYRVGAIIINDNKLLMVKNDNVPYYYSVGGRVKYGETSEQAVLREVYEETGCNFEIDRLAFVHENIFVEEVTKEPLHEIAFFYLMKDKKEINLKCESQCECGTKESLHWIPIDDLVNTHLYPKFFKQYITDIPQHTKIIIQK